MGLTPLAGLVMGTRSGDLDPTLHLLAEHEGMSPKALDELLNTKSGLQGLCGDNDMRQVLRRMAAGDGRAEMALAVYTYRIKAYIGAYMACLGHVDALVFTAGIGENAPCPRGLPGFASPRHRDRQPKKQERADGCGKCAADSRVKVLVVPTNEELRIAQETRRARNRRRFEREYPIFPFGIVFIW